MNDQETPTATKTVLPASPKRPPREPQPTVIGGIPVFRKSYNGCPVLSFAVLATIHSMKEVRVSLFAGRLSPSDLLVTKFSYPEIPDMSFGF